MPTTVPMDCWTAVKLSTANMVTDAALALVTAAFALLLRVFRYERKYVLSEERELTQQALHVLKEQPCTWSHGIVMVEGTQAPELHVSPTTWGRAERVAKGSYGDMDLVVHVCRWRWCVPLVPEPAVLVPLSAKGVKTIKVLERSSNETGRNHLRSAEELMLPRDIKPEHVRQLNKAADEVTARYGKAQTSQVVIVHGLAHAGKSTLARVIAGKLNGTLVTQYTPVRAGDDLMNMIAEHASDDHPLIVACEEVDIALAAMKAGTARDTDEWRLDATDKGSWNTLLDRLHAKANCVLVMTSNKTPDELRALADTKGTMLRAKRVDLWVAAAPVPGQRMCEYVVTVAKNDDDDEDGDDQTDEAARKDVDPPGTPALMPSPPASVAPSCILRHPARKPGSCGGSCGSSGSGSSSGGNKCAVRPWR